MEGPHRAAPLHQGTQLQVAGGRQSTLPTSWIVCSAVRELPDIRADKVARLKAAINAGVYAD